MVRLKGLSWFATRPVARRNPEHLVVRAGYSSSWRRWLLQSRAFGSAGYRETPASASTVVTKRIPLFAATCLSTT